MIWKYCEDCHINGHCENQDRGHECNVYAKRITDKAERLQKQLDIAVEGLNAYAKPQNINMYDDDCIISMGCRYLSDNGQVARKYLQRIEELNK